jgi:hypothetical protein
MSWVGDKIQDEVIDPIKDLGSKIDDEILQPLRPYAQEALTMVGTAFGGPAGAGLGSTVGGLIEGQEFGEALTSGIISGGTAGLLGPATPGAATSFSPTSFLDSLSQGVSGMFNSVGEFIKAPISTIKNALPSLAELPDIAVEKIQAELGRLPENAMNYALEMLKGADAQGVQGILGQGGGLMDILGSIGQGVIANNASKDIIDLNREQFNRAIELQRETRDIGIQRSEPFAQAGVQALPQLQQLAGQQIQPLGETGTTLEEINPLVNFLRNEGFQDIQESAAAKGRLQSGGTLQDLIRFNTDLSSTVVPQLQQQKFNQILQRGQFGQQQQQQQFNQLFDTARLGANAVSGQNTLASSVANNIGNLNQAFAGAQADALGNRANVLNQTLSNLITR